jgi:hypothetical protein
MKGIILIIIGIILGLFVGGYLCLFGGIVQIVNQIQIGIDGGVISATQIAWGVVRIGLAGLLGGLSAMVFILPGINLLGN